jgi:hypothetical protein
LEAEKAAELIKNAIELPTQMPEECVDWKSGFIDMQGGTVIKDGRNGELCMVVQVMECGITSGLFGVHEDSPTFSRINIFQSYRAVDNPACVSGSNISVEQSFSGMMFLPCRQQLLFCVSRNTSA